MCNSRCMLRVHTSVTPKTNGMPRIAYHTHAGVESFDVSLEEQKVTVRGSVTPEAVLEKVSKTGKKTEMWSS
jgi:copper chaperone CopZ